MRAAQYAFFCTTSAYVCHYTTGPCSPRLRKEESASWFGHMSVHMSMQMSMCMAMFSKDEAVQRMAGEII